jgi:hypothetical protein
MCVCMCQVEAVPSQVTGDSSATNVCHGDVTGDSRSIHVCHGDVTSYTWHPPKI